MMGRVMNLSIRDIEEEVLIVSQFTLHASTKRQQAIIYQGRKARKGHTIETFIKSKSGKDIGILPQTGKFRAMMKVGLVKMTDRVTIIIDSKRKE